MSVLFSIPKLPVSSEEDGSQSTRGLGGRRRAGNFEREREKKEKVAFEEALAELRQHGESVE